MRTIFTIEAEEKKLWEEKQDPRDGTCVEDRQKKFRTFFSKQKKSGKGSQITLPQLFETCDALSLKRFDNYVVNI